MKKALVGFMSLLISASMLLPGCSSSSSSQTQENAPSVASGEAETEKKTIAVLPQSMSQEFGADFVEAVTDAGEAAGYDITVLDPNLDLQTEISMMEDLIVQGVDGVIFSAIDTTSMGTVVEELKQAGIVVLDYDCTVDEGNTDASIKSDDELGGRMAAEILMEQVNDPNATIIVYGTASTIGTGYLRNKGFSEYMEENWPNVTLIETRPSEGAGTRDGCRAWAVDMVTTYPEVKGFFTFYGDGALGTYYGLKEAGRDDIVLVGYDATDEQQQIMKEDGENCILHASIAQYPEKMGEMSIEVITEIFEGSYTRSGPEDVFYIEPGVLYAAAPEEFE